MDCATLTQRSTMVIQSVSGSGASLHLDRYSSLLYMAGVRWSHEGFGVTYARAESHWALIRIQR